MSDGVERDDQTSPFPLEREKEETSPFPLERERSTERDPEATEHAPEAGEESEGEAELPPERATIRFTASARTARRSVVVALGVHSLALLAFASLSLVRWAKGVASPPELALSVVAIGIALLHLRASSQLSRLGADEKRDGAILAASLTGLRAVLVLKAIVLFGALFLICFVLSTALSLLASI